MIRSFFLSASLPIFLIGAAVVYESFLLALVFAPSGGGWWGRFADEFRIWCFSYDPRTGGMEWASVGMMLLEPLFVLGAAVLLWRKALPEWCRPRAWAGHWRSAMAGAAVAVTASASLLAFAGPEARAELPPFPGERIRTALAIPAYAFIDQEGRTFSLEDLRGRVVLVTGVYAACATSCPQILVDTRRLLEELPPAVRERVSVVALSLNPEYENTEIMAGMARAYGFEYPEFRYVSGEVPMMREALERLQFARVRNRDTGIIEHANLLLVIDPAGTIAYRFNADLRHAGWVREALQTLAVEAGTNAPDA